MVSVRNGQLQLAYDCLCSIVLRLSDYGEVGDETAVAAAGSQRQLIAHLDKWCLSPPPKAWSLIPLETFEVNASFSYDIPWGDCENVEEKMKIHAAVVRRDLWYLNYRPCREEDGMSWDALFTQEASRSSSSLLQASRLSLDSPEWFWTSPTSASSTLHAKNALGSLPSLVTAFICQNQGQITCSINHHLFDLLVEHFQSLNSLLALAE